MPANAEPPDPDELQAWLRLALTPGVGPVRGRMALSRLGSPQRILDAPAAVVADAFGSRGAADALFAADPSRACQITATVEWLSRSEPAAPRRLLALDDPQYPPRLFDLSDPPLLLYVLGDPACLDRPQIAVVGSRNATALGAATAESFAGAFVRAGWTVTSGLAEGIDRQAHVGALAALAAPGEPAVEGLPAPPDPATPVGVPGTTIAVMGTGADLVYPSRHRPLARRIASCGALVTEQPLGTRPHPANFPRRNRIIAALVRGVLVVEAAVRSGSLITAREAADLGREVCAVPGSIHSPLSRGCHRLLKQGAALAESADDVLSELSLPAGALAPGHPAIDPHAGEAADDGAGLEPAARALLGRIGVEPVSADLLSRQLDWPVASLLSCLQRLEIAGLLRNDERGGWYRTA